MGRSGAKPPSDETKRKNREREKARARANPEANRAKVAEWKALPGNAERKKKADLECFKKNHKKKCEQMNAYRKANRIELNKKTAVREKRRRKEDPAFAISCRLRARLGAFTRNHRVPKSGNTFKMVGMSPYELTQKLEKQLNSGEKLLDMAVDHVFPLAIYDISNPVEQHRSMHHSNLQPLPPDQNKFKNDKLPTKAMAAKVDRDKWPPGITEDMLPDIYEGWSTALRM